MAKKKAKQKVEKEEEPNSFPCDFEKCDVSCSSSKDLLMHKRVHDPNVRVFECTVVGCIKNYFKQAHVTRHVQSEHEGKTFPCGVGRCKKVFKWEAECLRHWNKDHDGFRPPKEVDNSLYKIGSDGGLETESAPASPSPSSALASAPPSPAPARAAAAQPSTRRARVRSSASCSPAKQSKGKKAKVGAKKAAKQKGKTTKKDKTDCDLCGKKYKTRQGLRVHHRKKHAQELDIKQARHQCSLCPMSFLQRSQLNNHYRQKHKKNVRASKAFVCTFAGCHASFADNRKLGAHYDDAHDGKKFACDFPDCGKTYTRRQNLDLHVLDCHAESATDSPDGSGHDDGALGEVTSVNSEDGGQQVGASGSDPPLTPLKASDDNRGAAKRKRGTETDEDGEQDGVESSTAAKKSAPTFVFDGSFYRCSIAGCTRKYRQQEKMARHFAVEHD